MRTNVTATDGSVDAPAKIESSFQCGRTLWSISNGYQDYTHIKNLLDSGSIGFVLPTTNHKPGKLLLAADGVCI